MEQGGRERRAVTSKGFSVKWTLWVVGYLSDGFRSARNSESFHLGARAKQCQKRVATQGGSLVGAACGAVYAPDRRFTHALSDGTSVFARVLVRCVVEVSHSGTENHCERTGRVVRLAHRRQQPRAATHKLEEHRDSYSQSTTGAIIDRVKPEGEAGLLHRLFTTITFVVAAILVHLRGL